MAKFKILSFTFPCDRLNRPQDIKFNIVPECAVSITGHHGIHNLNIYAGDPWSSDSVLVRNTLVLLFYDLLSAKSWTCFAILEDFYKPGLSGNDIFLKTARRFTSYDMNLTIYVTRPSKEQITARKASHHNKPAKYYENIMRLCITLSNTNMWHTYIRIMWYLGNVVNKWAPYRIV